MLNQIEINFVPKEAQRLECYRQEGAADYYFTQDKKTLIVNVTKFQAKDWRKQWLVLLHEIVELTLVLHSGIRFEEIDRFDEQMTGHDDPGSLEYAPYHKAHMTALKIEKMIAKKIGVRWGSY